MRTENTKEEQYRHIGRRNSDRENVRERDERDRYYKRNKVEAIVIHKPEQSESYADILKKANSSINISELGIKDTRIRRTAAGSLLIQIVGEESKRQADALAAEMRRVIGEEAKVAGLAGRQKSGYQDWTRTL